MDWRRPARAEDVEAAARVRASPCFDAAGYRALAGGLEAQADPALHYVMVGEAAGLRASAAFSAADYERLNPDLRAAPVNRLAHYELYGRAEGRPVAFAADDVGMDPGGLDPNRPTLLLLTPGTPDVEAPRFGAAILNGLRPTHNVVVIGLGLEDASRPLFDDQAAARVSLPPGLDANLIELDRLAERLTQVFDPLYVIADGVEMRLTAVALRGRGVPLVTLSNAFASASPPGALSALYSLSDAIVFPAEAVRRAAQRAYGLLAQRWTYVLPPGPRSSPRLARSVSPDAAAGSYAPDPDDDGLKLAGLLEQDERPFTVLGAGPVDVERGVDLFISAAAALRARRPELAFRFVWLGAPSRPPPDPYAAALDLQRRQGGLDESLILAAAPNDVDAIYAKADAAFVSARLDPYPEAGLDAALHGLPLLCFREATGLAERLENDPQTAWLVAPYLDTGAVAEALAVLALQPGARGTAGSAVGRLARETFDWKRYVRRLDEIGHQAVRRRAEVQARMSTLSPIGAFDAEPYFCNPLERPATREAEVRRYLEDAVREDFSGDAAWGYHPRRSRLGFHALAYGRLAPGFDAWADIDPLAHFLDSGCPAGPWSHKVIRLDEPAATSPPGPLLRVAIHGHFHYPDNIEDFLDALDANAAPLDLVLTTTSDAAARQLRRAVSSFPRGGVAIHVVENKGRDIGPFIKLLAGEFGRYDVVGHLHGKRSVDAPEPGLGDRWRRFLWRHLVGPAVPALDRVLDRFAADPKLGLVFPENDVLVGWEKTRRAAEVLAPRLGLGVLPEHLEFPAGTMFWARPQALRPLVDARFGDEEYPREPLPMDGTMLHALERLLPLVVESSGFGYATTYLRGVSRWM